MACTGGPARNLLIRENSHEPVRVTQPVAAVLSLRPDLQALGLSAEPSHREPCLRHTENSLHRSVSALSPSRNPLATDGATWSRCTVR